MSALKQHINMGLAGLVTLLGLAVMVGWVINEPTLMQILPQYAPMQFNTALLFFLSGLALLFCPKWHKICVLLGGFIALFALATFSQYIFQVHLGIDQLFVDAVVTTKTSHPGRMAPNTAISFLIVGCTLVANGVVKKQVVKMRIDLMVGIFLILIAIVAMVGYGTGVYQAYSWSNLTQMAVHTAVGFFLIGVAVLLSVNKSFWENDTERLYFIPLAIFVLGILLSVTAWQVVKNHEARIVAEKVKREGMLVAESLGTALEKNLSAIERIFLRAQADGYSVDRVLEIDMEFYIKQIPDLVMLSLKHKGKQFIDQKEGYTDLEISSVCEASENEMSVETSMYMSYGDKLVCFYSPVHQNYAIISPEIFVQKNLTAEIISHYDIELLAGEHSFFHVGIKSNYLTESYPVNYGYGVWTLILSPSEKFVSHENTLLSSVYLAAMLLFSTIFSMLAWYWCLNRYKEHEIDRQNALMNLSYKISHSLSQTESFKEGLSECLNLICETLNWPFGHVYWANEEATLLLPTDIWYLQDDKKLFELKNATKETAFEKGEGLPGNVWKTGMVEFMEDIHSKKCAKRASYLKETNIHSGVAFPIFAGNVIYGVIELFSIEKRSYDAELMNTLHTLGEQMSRIFEREQNIKALKKSLREIEEVNKKLDEFVYVSSHDFKEPLRGISNYAAFLLHDYQDKLNDEGVKKLKTLTVLAARLEALIDAMLSYSQIGRVELAFRRVNLDELLKERLKMASFFFDENNVNICFKKPLPTIVCDPIYLIEAFYNFITNAVKYNDSKEKHIDIDYTETDSDYVFSIADNGIGIPEEYQDQIFKFFKRLHGRNEYGGGSGAGMSITQKIIERHNGVIKIDSIPGKGTTFTFTISKSLENE